MEKEWIPLPTFPGLWWGRVKTGTREPILHLVVDHPDKGLVFYSLGQKGRVTPVPLAQEDTEYTPAS